MRKKREKLNRAFKNWEIITNKIIMANLYPRKKQITVRKKIPKMNFSKLIKNIKPKNPRSSEKLKHENN